MANNEIRETAKKNGVRLWLLAKELGISEATLTRLLRFELPEEKKQEILCVINRIAGNSEKG